MIPDATLAIVPQTFLAKVTPERVAEILGAGRELKVAAGRLLPRKGKHPGVAIVVEGLVRVFLESPRQRQVTVRYARPGETLGLVHLLGGKLDVHAQAVTASTLWALPPRKLRTLADESPKLAVAIAEECAARTADAIEELALLTFGSVRQQVARHLLDLAASEAEGEELVAMVTHKELADATGSVREVVARVLKALHGSGLTRQRPDGVVVVDAAGLDAEARGLGDTA